MNAYAEKRALGYRANQLFSTKQTEEESVSDWIQLVQISGSKLRKAAEQDERAGVLTLSDKLRNIYFVQDLSQTEYKQL
jgi:uncharacterized protein YaeQ